MFKPKNFYNNGMAYSRTLKSFYRNKYKISRKDLKRKLTYISHFRAIRLYQKGFGKYFNFLPRRRVTTDLDKLNFISFYLLSK